MPKTEEHSTRAKRQYSDDLAREFSAEVESNLRTHFPNTSDADRNRPRASSLNYAVAKFRGFQERTSIRDDFELLEKIYVGLYDESGEVRFVDVAHHLQPLEIPFGAKVSTFEQIKDDLVWLFRQRNPEAPRQRHAVDDSGAVTAASPALDEAFSDD